MFALISIMAAVISGCKGMKPIYKWPGAVQTVLQTGQNEYQPLPHLPLRIVEGKPEQYQDVVTDDNGLAIYYLKGLGPGTDAKVAPDYWLVYVQGEDEIRFPGVAYMIVPFVFEAQGGALKPLKTIEVRR